MPKLSPQKIALGGLLLAGALLAAGFWFKQSLSSANAPATVQRAFEKMLAAQNMHVQLSMNLNMPQTKNAVVFPKMTLAAEGDVRPVPQGVEFAGQVKGQAEGPGNIIYAASDVKLFNDTTYFRLNSFPAILNPPTKLMSKWTSVAKPVLSAADLPKISSGLMQLAQGFTYQGTIQDSGQTYERYVSRPDPASVAKLADALALEQSHNHAFDYLAGTLRQNPITGLEVWLKRGSREVAKIAVTAGGNNTANAAPFANLSIAIGSYNQGFKDGGIPQAELSVKPEIFSNLLSSAPAR